jgi:hypothetical protein
VHELTRRVWLEPDASKVIRDVLGGDLLVASAAATAVHRIAREKLDVRTK